MSTTLTTPAEVEKLIGDLKLEILPCGFIKSTTHQTVKVRLAFQKTSDGHRFMHAGEFLEKPKSIRRTRMKCGADQADSWVWEHVQQETPWKCADEIEEVLRALPHRELCGQQVCDWEGELTMPVYDVAVYGGVRVKNPREHGEDAVLYFPFTTEELEAAIDFAELDAYGHLSYAVGSGDDLVCFDFYQHANGDFSMHSVVNSETGGFIQDMQHEERVSEAEAVAYACGLIDQGMDWVYHNGGRHSVRGWNQDPYFFAREVAAAIARRHGAPYKRVPRKNGKIPL